ncbi:MAG: hypothetical protein Q9170_004004 [Blastenia crenularia]
MHIYALSVPAVVVGLLAGSSHAFWRLSCGIVQTSRIDPIINPGATSPHAHKIAGASNVNQQSTFDSLQQAKCSSCAIQDDKSAYWTPPLYYQHPNGSFEEVPNNGMAIYYEGRGDDKNLQPFPPGFRMVSGNKNARSYNKQALIPLSDRPIADRVSFACLDANPSKEQPGMTETNCKNGLRAQIHFQSCWNGKDLYKPDNSHVEYMSGLDNGKCPSTHPVAFMHLFYEILYGVNDINKDGGRFVFSQGDTTGFGFHGDFLNGWKADVLNEAVKLCGSTNDGAVENCAPFKPSLDPNFGKDCPELPSLLNEPVHGMIAKLPGCIKITSGPQDATDADNTCGAGQTSDRESLPDLNSTISSGTNLTVGVNTLLPQESIVQASSATISVTTASTSVQATQSPEAEGEVEEDTSELKRRSFEKRDIPDVVDSGDDYGYTFQFPPTVTSHRPSPPNGSPVPRRHDKRAVPYEGNDGDDYGYGYGFESPPTVTSHRPSPPNGSPVPRRHNKRTIPDEVAPGDDYGYGYDFEFPPIVTSRRPKIPVGSPAPHRRQDKRHGSSKKL